MPKANFAAPIIFSFILFISRPPENIPSATAGILITPKRNKGQFQRQRQSQVRHFHSQKEPWFLSLEYSLLYLYWTSTCEHGLLSTACHKLWLLIMYSLSYAARLIYTDISFDEITYMWIFWSHVINVSCISYAIFIFTNHFFAAMVSEFIGWMSLKIITLK